MIAKEINITHTGQILASFIIGLCLCLWTALNMKPAIGVAIGFIPFATLFIFICINKPAILYKPQNKMFHFCKTFCSKITLVNTIQNVILNRI